jgi:hypothetical protein
MIGPFLTPEKRIRPVRRIGLWAGACGAAACLVALPVLAQITIDTRTGTVTNGTDTSTVAGTVDRRYAQVEPTHVQLPKRPLDARDRDAVIRFLQSEQGFAMRPFPRGHKGLLLNANGTLDPAGEGYLQLATANGICAKPGDRVVLSDVKVERSKIVFQINGGPDRKHRFLSHVEIGTGPMMGPVVQDNDPDPVGARLTLTFKGDVPDLTGKQVEDLLAPMIEFGVKTPIEAFTDTLPPKLKKAILDHQVLVGMSTDMVLFAKGQPNNKMREMDGQMPFEEWIYGKPPQDVVFVRVNGNRVIRVEIAKIGKEPEIFTKDEVEGLMRTDGTPLEAKNNTRVIKEGDVEHDPNKEAQAPPPTLRNPGEKLPQDDDKDTQNGRVGVMRPVQFPNQKQDSDSTQPNSTQAQPNGTQTNAPAQNAPGSNGTQTQSSAPTGSGTPASSQPQPTSSGSSPSGQDKPAQTNQNQ